MKLTENVNHFPTEPGFRTLPVGALLLLPGGPIRKISKYFLVINIFSIGRPVRGLLRNKKILIRLGPIIEMIGSKNHLPSDFQLLKGLGL